MENVFTEILRLGQSEKPSGFITFILPEGSEGLRPPPSGFCREQEGPQGPQGPTGGIWPAIGFKDS